MDEWKQKLEALMKGLHIVDQEKFIDQGEVGDYKTLGEMIYQNGGSNKRRIGDLERRLTYYEFFRERVGVIIDDDNYKFIYKGEFDEDLKFTLVVGSEECISFLIPKDAILNPEGWAEKHGKNPFGLNLVHGGHYE